MGRVVTTFARGGDFEEALRSLEAHGLPFEVITPEPAYALVGAGAIVMDENVRPALAAAGCDLPAASGWVRQRRAAGAVPGAEPPVFAEDIFGRAAVMILASCSADENKIRTIAHISGDMCGAFPYLNAEMKHASYNAAGDTFTFMEDYRLITLYPHRIAVAKADDVVDAWRVLESVRCRLNDVWARRAAIEPSYAMRRRPGALEIYARLPGINCGECGLATCLAFAMRVHGGHVAVNLCKPVFGGAHGRLRDALAEVSAGMVGASG